MRNVVAVIAVLLICLAVLEPCVARRQPGLVVVDEADHGLVVVQAGDLISSAAVEMVEFSHRRSLLKTKSSKKKSTGGKPKLKKKKKRKGANWSKAQQMTWGSVIAVACFISIVVLCLLFCIMTEKKKKEDPNWHLFKRQVKPGVKRKITRTFTRKKVVHEDGNDDLMKPNAADPPKLPS